MRNVRERFADVMWLFFLPSVLLHEIVHAGCVLWFGGFGSFTGVRIGYRDVRLEFDGVGPWGEFVTAIAPMPVCAVIGVVAAAVLGVTTLLGFVVLAQCIHAAWLSKADRECAVEAAERVVMA